MPKFPPPAVYEETLWESIYRERAEKAREKKWRREKESAEIRADYVFLAELNWFDDEGMDGMRALNRRLENMEHFNQKKVRESQVKAIAMEAARRSLPEGLLDVPERIWCPLSESEIESDDEEEAEDPILDKLPTVNEVKERKVSEKWKLKSRRARRRSKKTKKQKAEDVERESLKGFSGAADKAES